MARLRRAPRPPLPRYAVAWFPAFAGIGDLEQFRARHDPMASLVPAHLSLVFPFATSHSRLQVQVHVERIAARFPPIPVSFKRVRTEANEFVFLMASRGAASIKELHDRLYTRSLRQHLRDDMPYEPHITIARYTDYAKLQAALAEAEECFGVTHEAVIRSVVLLSVERDGKINRLKDISLDTA